MMKSSGSDCRSRMPSTSGEAGNRLQRTTDTHRASRNAAECAYSSAAKPAAIGSIAPAEPVPSPTALARHMVGRWGMRQGRAAHQLPRHTNPAHLEPARSTRGPPAYRLCVDTLPTSCPEIGSAFVDLVEARLRPIPILTSRRGCATCSGSRRRLPVPDDRYVAVGCGQPTRAASPRQQSVPGVSNAGSVSVDVRDCEVSAAFSWSSRCPVPRAAHRLMPRGRSASNDRRPAGNTAH